MSDGPASPRTCRVVSRCAAWVLIACVRGYQVTLGPFMGGHCRYQPTCSAYAIDAIRAHGPLKGGWLAFKRIIRCHPWGGCGYDPVPTRSSTSGRPSSAHTVR